MDDTEHYYYFCDGRPSAPSTSRSRLGLVRPRKPKLCALEVLLIGGSINDLAQDQLEVELSIGVGTYN